MQAAAAFSLAAALTFAPASVLTAALPFAAPADVYAAVVEGSHAVDPAALSGRESYGPGTVGAFREQKTDDVSGSGTVGGSQAQSSYSSADLLTLPCPAGLEPDLWEAAKVSVRLYDEAVRTNLAEVNAVRKAAGVPEVVPDQELCMIAAYRAAQISKYRHLSHYGASGEYLANIVAQMLRRAMLPRAETPRARLPVPGWSRRLPGILLWSSARIPCFSRRKARSG